MGGGAGLYHSGLVPPGTHPASHPQAHGLDAEFAFGSDVFSSAFELSAAKMRELDAQNAALQRQARNFLQTSAALNAGTVRPSSVLAQTAAQCPGVQVDVKRILLARAMRPLPGNGPLVQALQSHAKAVFGEAVPALGTPLYTDVRLFSEAGIPGVIYGAGPRTVLESNAKRADEHIVLEDLRRATQVMARSLVDLLA